MQYPDFVDDKEFISMDSNVSENEQLRGMLDNLTRVHLLTAKKYNSFDELIHEYIQCGIEIFGLETGIVSHIDENEIYQVMDVISPVEALVVGLQFPLADTYCTEVFKTQKVLGFPHVSNLDFMKCHPVYIQLKLEAYLSAPIYVEGKLYGTFNFTSIIPRINGFSQNEHNLIELMANSIGNFILLRSKEDKLLELNEKLKSFVGFVAHDLRSPIASIIGLSRLLETQLDNDVILKKMLPKITETAEETLELVGKILNTAALSTGKITLNKQNIALQKLMDEANKSVVDVATYCSVTLQWNINAGAQVFCDSKMMTQAMINLLVNAIKYSPAGGTVYISAIESDSGNLISIDNLHVVSGKANTALPSVYDSVGFGLEIVDTILKAHDAELEIINTDLKFNASFILG
ncbi:MAG: GAF domain-containing sensor histidine kinase [Oleispira sp.]